MMQEKTATEYKQVIAACKALFLKKTKDYGTAWRIMILPSITDQIFIKAQRIRSLQEKGTMEEASALYDAVIDETVALQQNKNHDYAEAWREMQVESMTDIILMKLLRIKQIENNEGKTLASEGVTANYQDMINYAVFCLIKLKDS